MKTTAESTTAKRHSGFIPQGLDYIAPSVRAEFKLAAVCAWLYVFEYSTTDILMRLLNIKGRNLMRRLEEGGYVRSINHGAFKSQKIWLLTSDGMSEATAVLGRETLTVHRRTWSDLRLHYDHTIGVQRVALVQVFTAMDASEEEPEAALIGALKNLLSSREASRRVREKNASVEMSEESLPKPDAAYYDGAQFISLEWENNAKTGALLFDKIERTCRLRKLFDWNWKAIYYISGTDLDLQAYEKKLEEVLAERSDESKAKYRTCVQFNLVPRAKSF